MNFDAHYDVVVIGGGGAGLSAAVQVAKNGNTCAVLEKAATTGGSSSFAEGHAAFESDEQKKRGIDVSKTLAFNTYMNYSHYRANPAIVSKFVENASTTIVKMREVGTVYESVEITAPDQPGELVTWHLPEGEVARVIELLEADAVRRGVDLFLSTRATEILKENGNIVGVKAIDADGEEVLLGAKAVVVGTGGYACNPEMMDKYAKHNAGKALINIGSPTNTGDGISMVLAAGGVEDSNIGTRLLFPIMRDKTITSHTNAAGFQPYLWVNSKGERFINEEVALNFGNAGDVVVGLDGHMFWTILSQEAIDHLVNVGNEVGIGIYVRNYEKLVNLPGEIQADAADASRDNVFAADSIEELAKKIGLDSAKLRAEVDEYNKFSDEGFDSKFYKKSKYLYPVKKGPFYAIKMETGIMITMGALKIDEYMRALDKDGKPINGLYVVGCDAGGMYGESYSLPIPGSANGFALTSGWLAADDIIARINAKEL
ncbi:FAD-dependent oxidoreductase [Campylobacter sp.]|uniref:FAD-dependent oxidoreductase n=1 Tax=Campylobacter sp. TaxID=205 RepID=UPI0029079EF1|nr:FAD-dependent oxidoreductase [Campylobacter sp.]MDU6828396.1 FAD-dependent oxidoreductase [Campylobacter sp.]